MMMIKYCIMGTYTLWAQESRKALLSNLTEISVTFVDVHWLLHDNVNLCIISLRQSKINK